MRCRWKVIVRGEGQGWEHLNLAEDQAEMITLPTCCRCVCLTNGGNKKWMN